MVSEGDTDSVQLKLGKEHLEQLHTKEKVRSLFPLDYFSNMIKAVSTADNLTINLGNDYPVRLEFEVAGGRGRATFLLAPRIEQS
jgi:proliferating cell nuclear antigen